VFNLFGKSASLDDLISRKKYAQALVVMREEFRRKSPDAPGRQRYADLLILADRKTEAIPILLGLADEHLRFGFLEKAKEALARLEQLEAGREDVAERLRRITELENAPKPTLLDRKSRLAARRILPETKPAVPVVAAVEHAPETKAEPAAPDEWETDLSSPIAMLLDPPPLDRHAASSQPDDAIEVDPLEGVTEADENSDPIHVELMDLFSRSESGLSAASRAPAPPRRAGSPGR
jgi:hypothetical protein